MRTPAPTVKRAAPIKRYLPSRRSETITTDRAYDREVGMFLIVCSYYVISP